MTQTPPTAVFGPYSPIVKSGEFNFISGQIGVNPATKNTPENVTDQTRQALDNLRDVLEKAGLNLGHVVKTTIFLTDMGDFPAVNEVYLTYFDEPRPARSTVGVKELPRVGGGGPLLVEIEAVAASTPRAQEAPHG